MAKHKNMAKHNKESDVCPECEGKGNDGYHKTEVCSLCDGTGKVGAVAKVDEEEETGEGEAKEGEEEVGE